MTTENSTASVDTSVSTSDSFEQEAHDQDLFDDLKPQPKAKSDPKPEQKTVKDESDPKTEQKQKRFLKAKVDGKEELVDEETLLREYQKAKAGSKRLEEATRIKKEAEEFLNDLKSDPEKVLSDPRLGIDKQKLAMKWLESQLTEELSDPVEIKTRELEAKLRAYEEKELSEKQAKEEAEESERNQRLITERREHFQKTFEQAMEQSILSKTPETAATALREMALEYRLAKSQGYEPTPEELASSVENRQFKMMHSAASQLEGDQLVQFLGEEVVNKIRRYDLSRLQISKQKPQTQDSDWTSEEPKKGKAKTIDPVDYRMRIRNNDF